MRRAQNVNMGQYAYDPYGSNSDTQRLAEESEEMTAHLKDKVKALKSDDDFHKSGNFLERSMKRLGIISKGSHNYHLLILFAFCFVVFLLLWVALKFR
ncbi:BET1 homolog isoform X3 [Cherax quadricarinatus]|uniref:BET1 homolog isoform X3 n=1 Tax=Cherax quadricarinatus TaxID=27406 RepID=UPI00387E81D3